MMGASSSSSSSQVSRCSKAVRLSRRNCLVSIRAIGLGALFAVMMVFLAAVRHIYRNDTPERS